MIPARNRWSSALRAAGLRLILGITLGAVAGSLLSCSKQQQPVDLVTFPLYGRVISVDTAEQRVTVHHDAIPNYMPAMVMPFKVKDATLLKEVAAGDSIGATLAVSRTESWLETLQVLNKGERATTLTAEQVEFRHLYQQGETIPDIQLLNQENRPLRLSNFRGKVVALTFVYTRCPLPDFCIRMSEQFAQVEKKLHADHTLDGRWHLLTVSFDPPIDRPSVLKQYGENYGADFRDWDFATDPDTNGKAVGPFADGFGLTYEPSEGLINHNLRTAVIDPQGRLVEVFQGNDWKPGALIAAIRSAL